MAKLVVENLTKRFGSVAAVDRLSFTAEDREFLVLIGPSGCGKSTTLNLIAGLEEASAGRISIGDRLVTHLHPKDRDIAMVFQNYALYPHMNVYANMAFGLSMRGYSKAEIDRRIHEAAEILGIGNLLQRKPRALSGGQRQRVAVGRAIVRKPAVFLFDEPLSNLDAKLRIAMRAEISKLHHRLQTTFIYVTHDQMEAMTMATRIAVINKGTLQQLDTPQVLYDTPVNMFVAGFIGAPAMNFFKGHLRKDGGKLFADCGSFSVPIPSERARSAQPFVDKPIVLGIRPEDIFNPTFVPPGIEAAKVSAKVDVTELMGNEIFLYLVAGENTIVARVDPRTDFRIGDDVQVSFNMDKMHLFDPDTELAIH
jgi:multiple sugar transport system ATP-binding protein